VRQVSLLAVLLVAALALAGCGSDGSDAAPNSDAGLGYTDVAVVGLLHAFVLMMIIATIGGASGAHVNPAVTVALLAVRKIAPVDAAIYILVQLAGAVLAVLVVKLLIQDGSADAANFAAPAVSENFLNGKALAGFVGEGLGTFALMWAIMGVAVNPTAAKDWAPFVIGATLGLAVFALGEDDVVYHRWQDKPFGVWHGWESLGGPVESVGIGKSRGGGLALFAVGTDAGVRYRYQSKPSGAWSQWIDLQGKAQRLAAQMSYADGLEVFAIGLDDEVSHKWCDRLDSAWTDWIPLDHESSSFHLARDKTASP